MDILFSRIRLGTFKLAGQRGLECFKHRRHANFGIAYALNLHHFTRVIERNLRGEFGRHHHGMHTISPECIDRNCQRQGRVHTTRQSQQDTGKTVFVDIVTQCHDQRTIHTRLDRQCGVNRTADDARVELHEPQCLFEFAFLVSHRAIRIDAKRCAIEEQFVLTARPVGIQKRHANFLHPRANHVVARFEFLEIVGRRIRYDDQLGTCRLRCGDRLGEPDIFANQHRNLHAFMFEHEWLIAGLEIALLIEYLIVWQALFEIRANYLALVNQRCGVVKFAVFNLRVTNYDFDARYARRHFRECGSASDAKVAAE